MGSQTSNIIVILVFGMMICALFSYAEHIGRHKEKYTMTTRGYVKKTGDRWEYGLSDDTGEFKILGVKRTAQEANLKLNRFLRSDRLNIREKST